MTSNFPLRYQGVPIYHCVMKGPLWWPVISHLSIKGSQFIITSSRAPISPIVSSKGPTFPVCEPNAVCLVSWKRKHRPQFLIVRLIFQRLCDYYQCMILVFSLIYLDIWVYIRWGPVRLLEKCRSLFPPPFFFFFVSLFPPPLFFCLSQGPLYLWGPWTSSTHATQSLHHRIIPGSCNNPLPRGENPQENKG